MSALWPARDLGESQDVSRSGRFCHVQELRQESIGSDFRHVGGHSVRRKHCRRALSSFSLFAGSRRVCWLPRHVCHSYALGSTGASVTTIVLLLGFTSDLTNRQIV